MDHRRSNPLVRVFFLLLILALGFSSARAAQDVWEGVERIVAIGDIHGDYERFLKLLQDAGLINAKRKWIGGKAHLVQTGDVVDRGPQSRKVMDLLIRLERQARKAKGHVHALIGNHEAMNIYGDLRYVSPEEYAAFQDRESENRRKIFYDRHIERLRDSPPLESLPPFDPSYQREWESRHPLGFFEHRFEVGPNGRYGKWIRGHNTVIRINDTNFLHGGISPKYAGHSLRLINDRVREELEDFSKLEAGIVTDMEGPLWYRGLAQDSEEEVEPSLDAILTRHGVKTIVMGHTVTWGAVMPRLGARVVLIDVGLSAFYGGRFACLLIEKGRNYALHRGKKLELPTDSGSGLICYLKEAAALDPEPSPLLELLRKIETPQVSSLGR